MKIYRDIEQLPFIPNAVVTTGSFDGVHIGHQVLINRLNELAHSVGGESVLLTFYPHVRKVLYPETAGKDLEMINSQQEKTELLEKTGLNNLVIINFTREFAKTTAEEFVENILVGKLGAKIIVVGYNHYFGHNKEGNYDKLMAMGKRLGFEVVEIPKQDIENETVGSSKIRRSLKDGKIMHANAYLDHIYFINTMFCEGSKVYNEIGYKTFGLTVDEDSKLIPPDGIYAIRVIVDNKNLKGMMLNNYHGTFIHPGLMKGIEVILLEAGINCCQKTGKVFVHKDITDNLDFRNTSNLKWQFEQAKIAIEDLIY